MMRLLLLICLSMLFLSSCRKDKAAAFNCTNEVSFTQEVQPLIDMNCSISGCHDVTAEGGYEFKDHATISSAIDKIVAAINHESGTTPMPLGADKLSDSSLRIIVCWSSAGALDN